MKTMQVQALRGQYWVPIILIGGLGGYPLLGTLIALTSLPSLVVSIPVRLLVAVASIAMLLGTRSLKLTVPSLALWLFWFLYLLRLAWDTTVVNLQGADEALFFFTATCLLPAAAILRSQRRGFDEPQLARLFLIFGLATCLLAVLVTVADLSAGRSLLAETERLSFDTVNPITYGHVATTTIIAAFSLLRSRGRRTALGLAIVAVGIGGVTLQLAASRGPAVALAACLLVAGIFQRRLLWGVIVGASLTGLLLAVPGNALESRFSSVEDDLSTLGRIELQTNAIDQFLDSPLVGSAYIEKELETYPHNPLIESAMATGVAGLALFTVVVVSVVFGAIRLLRQGLVFVPLLAIQYLIGSMLSGALYLSTHMWIVFALVFALSQTSHRARQKVTIPTDLTAHPAT